MVRMESRSVLEVGESRMPRSNGSGSKRGMKFSRAVWRGWSGSGLSRRGARRDVMVV